MERFKNYGLWVAVAALGGMIVQDLGLQIAPERYEMYVDVALTIAVAAGVISNPSIGKGFRDRNEVKEGDK
jgi:uncharacterized membrane protein